MKQAILLLIVLTTFSCAKPDPNSFIPHLEGYWEIDEVVLADGKKHTYNFNDTVDFWEVSDSLTGFRKKLQPRIGGTYETSDDQEYFVLRVENDSLNVYYKTDYAQWKETILKATESSLLIQNKDKIKYLYKRYEPILLD